MFNLKTCKGRDGHKALMQRPGDSEPVLVEVVGRSIHDTGLFFVRPVGSRAYDVVRTYALHLTNLPDPTTEYSLPDRVVLVINLRDIAKIANSRDGSAVTFLRRLDHEHVASALADAPVGTAQSHHGRLCVVIAMPDEAKAHLPTSIDASAAQPVAAVDVTA